MNVVFVGRLFDPYHPTTIDLTQTVLRDGIKKANEECPSISPSVLKALLKRHRRAVIRSA